MRILYICTHNRCRSIIAEAVTRELANGLIEVASAGSDPAGRIHPLSLKYLQECGIHTGNLRSQSWHEFEDFKPDAIIMMCDQAAEENCPTWFGDGVRVNWSLADPSKVYGNEDAIRQAFYATIRIVQQRIGKFLEADFKTMSGDELAQQLHKLALQRG